MELVSAHAEKTRW